MKKRAILVSLIASIFMLSGCSIKERINEKLKDEILRQSGIENNESYNDYLRFVNNQQVDSEGYYIPQEEEDNKGSIKVSFLESSAFNIEFFYDEEKTMPVDTKNCFVNPGDLLYANLPKLKNTDNSQYLFQRFEMFSYDDSKNRELISSFDAQNLAIKIPDSFDGNHLSIMVIGDYEDRNISLSAYCEGPNGKIELNGQWLVNGQNVKGTSAIISGSSSYGVTYRYGNYVGHYYFLNSNPKAIKVDDAIGLVEFKTESYDSNTNYFEVELKEYKSLTVKSKEKNLISSSHINSLKINNENVNIDLNVANTSVEQLKVGDIIIVTVDSGYKINTQNISIENTIKNKDLVEYKLVIPDTNEEMIIECSKETATLGGFQIKQISLGFINVFLESDGSLISEGQEVDDEDKVIVKITPYNNCYVSGKDVEGAYYRKTMKYKDYVKSIDKIISEHEIKEYIRITINTKDKYGTCTAKVGNYEMQDGLNKTFKVKEGDTIEFTFTLENDKYKYPGMINLSKNKTVKIKVDESMNGKTLIRNDFIEIVEK